MGLNPLDVLKPNYMGDFLNNTGVGEATENRGFGVREALNANPQAMAQQEEPTSSSGMAMKDKLRTAKAREFGLTKQTVGF